MTLQRSTPTSQVYIRVHINIVLITYEVDVTQYVSANTPVWFKLTLTVTEECITEIQEHN